MNCLVFSNIVKETCRRLNWFDAQSVINGKAMLCGSAEIYMSLEMNHTQPRLFTKILLNATKSAVAMDVLIKNFNAMLSNQPQQDIFISPNHESSVITLEFTKKIADVNCKTLSENLHTIAKGNLLCRHQ